MNLNPKTTAFVFPGQGSQAVGMGQALVEAYPVAAAAFAEADNILGFALSALCFSGPADVLTDTRNAQPAILTASVAAWRALHTARPELPGPCCVAGHSMGEYSALVVAGALSFADGVRLTRERGRVMAQAGTDAPGSMAAILKLEDEQVAELCWQAATESGDVVQVANYNSPGQVVISGSAAGVAAATALAKAAGGRVMPLAVTIAENVQRQDLHPLEEAEALRTEIHDARTEALRQRFEHAGAVVVNAFARA